MLDIFILVLRLMSDIVFKFFIISLEIQETMGEFIGF